MRNATTKGNKSILLTRQACLTPSVSNIDIAASIITPASAAVGIYVNKGVRNCVAITTSKPVTTPPAGVCTPDWALTAVREKLPVTG